MACRCLFSKHLPRRRRGAQGRSTLFQNPEMMCWGVVTEESWSRKFLCPRRAHIHDCVSPTTPSGSHSLLSSRCRSSCQAWGARSGRPGRGLHLLSSGPAGPSREEQPVGNEGRGLAESQREEAGSPRCWEPWSGQEEKAPCGVGSGQVPQGGCVCPAQPPPWHSRDPASPGL